MGNAKQQRIEKKKGGKRILEESQTDEADVAAIGGDGYVEIPPGTEMQVPVVNYVQKDRDGEEEVGVMQCLPIVEYSEVNIEKGEF